MYFCGRRVQMWIQSQDLLEHRRHTLNLLYRDNRDKDLRIRIARSYFHHTSWKFRTGIAMKDTHQYVVDIDLVHQIAVKENI